MSYPFKFKKILEIKDHEKEQMMIEYNEAVSQFENVLEKLYEYLKQKEDLEENQKSMLNVGLSIQMIQQQQQWIKNLEKIIMHYQTKVIRAREIMQQKQFMLQEKNIEVKKYQKLKENYLHSLLSKLKESDNKVMDEISIQQYMYRGN